MLWLRIGFGACCVVVVACGESTVESGSTTQSSTTANTGGAAGGGATGGAATGGSSSGGASTAGYRAFGYSGGLEHLTVVKFDEERDTCVRIFLAAPQDMSALPITVPGEWGVVVAEMGEGAALCTAVPPLTSSYAPSGGSGTIDWELPASCPTCPPTALDIHATLTFEPGPEWLPASESLDADGIVVESWQ